MSSKRNILFVVLAVGLFISCNNQPTSGIDAGNASVAAKKDTCIACKQPTSRKALINASFKENSEVVKASAAGMVLIKGGSFQMGSNDFPDSKPVHAATVNSFYMDEHEVTNA